MKIIFIATSEFAIKPLKKLISKNFNISAVITQPDKPAGRGKKLLASPIKLIAQQNNIKILQPENINSSTIENFIKQEKIDLGIVISYGQIIKKNIFSIPKYNIINLHPSLLPKYRGPSPIQSALLNGDTKTGNTLIEITENMDAGPILLQEELYIDETDDFFSLQDKLSAKGAELIINLIDILKNKGCLNKIYQDNFKATYCKKIDKNSAIIDWNNPSKLILNQVRALCKWPVAYTYLNKKILKIYKAEIVANDSKNFSPGTFVKLSKKSFGVVCGDKKILKINQLQLQGKKILNSQDFLNGIKINTGDRLGID